jgi:hypothetical protein
MALGLQSPEKSQLTSGSSSSSEPAGPEVETAVSRSQVDHIWYLGRLGYALAKALTEAGSLVAWRIETESKGNRVKNGWYLLVDGRWRSRIRDGLHRYLRYETNAQQVLYEGAGVISPLGVGTLRGSDARRCLRCEDDT